MLWVGWLIKPVRFLIINIILDFVTEIDVAFVFSKASRLVANFSIIAVVLMLAVGDEKDHLVGGNGRFFRPVVCILLVAPLGVTIGFNARYHVAWMDYSEDTLSYWRKYAISDVSFCAVYLLIAVEILLWSVMASFQGVIPRSV